MKKLTLTSILSLFAASAALAATTVDKTVMGGAGNYSTRVPIPKDNKNYNIILESPDATLEGAMFSGNGATVASLDGATNTPGTTSGAGKYPAWNFTGDMTIDINSAEAGNVTALKTGANKFTWNLGTLTIKNSQSNGSTYADIDLGEQFRMTVNTPKGQTSKLIVETNANMSGNSLAFAANDNGGLFVQNKATVNYKVANSNFASGTLLFVGQNATLDASAGEYLFTFYAGSTLRIASGGTFKAQKITNYMGCNAEINGNFEYVGKGQLNVANVSIDGGKFVAQNFTTGTNARTVVSGNMIVANGGTIDQKGGIELKGTAASTASLTVEKNAGYIKLYDNNEYNGRLFLTGYAQIAINKADAFTRVLANGTTENVTLMLSSQNNRLIVNEQTKIGKFHYWNGATGLTIELSNENADAKLYIGDLTGTGNNTLTIDNFDNDMLCFWTGDESKVFNYYETIIANGVDGNTYGKNDLTLVKGTLDGKDVYYLNLKNIPEPAEWAAIFGAIALALAVYRRRK